MTTESEQAEQLSRDLRAPKYQRAAFNFKPGIIHAAATFDQEEVWVTDRADVLQIDQIHPDHARNIVLFLIRNASRFRRAYIMQTYALEVFGCDPDEIGSLYAPDFPDETQQQDQRWILECRVTRAVMRRVLDTEPVTASNPQRDVAPDHADSDHIWTHEDGTPR